MKSLSKFEAFKLDKNQMNAVTGGIVCYVDFGDGEKTLQVDPSLDFNEAVNAAAKAYGHFFRGCE